MKLIFEETIPKEEQCMVYPLIEITSFIGDGALGKERCSLDPEYKQKRKIWDAAVQQSKDYSIEDIARTILDRMNGVDILNAALLHQLLDRLREKITSI